MVWNLDFNVPNSPYLSVKHLRRTHFISVALARLSMLQSFSWLGFSPVPTKLSLFGTMYGTLWEGKNQGLSVVELL